MRYTAELIKKAVEEDIDRLFKPWTVGRPEGWIPSHEMKQLIALGYWLNEELECRLVSPEDRRTQNWKFNRMSRTYDIWETASECMNDVVDDNVEQNRVGHRRWG